MNVCPKCGCEDSMFCAVVAVRDCKPLWQSRKGFALWCDACHFIVEVADDDHMEKVRAIVPEMMYGDEA